MSPTGDLPERWHQDVTVDEPHVRSLLTELPHHLAHLRDAPLRFVAEGWDNSVWRVGRDHAARIPLRPMAAPLVLNEARWVTEVTAVLRDTETAFPQPVHLTTTGPHPHPWLLVRWVGGDLLEEAPGGRGDLAAPLAGALSALHRPAPADAPLNPFRGADLRDLPAPRSPVVTAAREVLGHDVVDGLLRVHAEGLDAAPWLGPRLWCHGDLHPRNLVRTPAGGLGLLDFGDVTAGDPAVDLGVWWTTFTAEERAPHVAELAARYDEAVAARARAWAARFVLGVAGNAPAPFTRTLTHTVTQLLT